MDVSSPQAQDHTHLRDLLTSSRGREVSPVSGGFGKGEGSRTLQNTLRRVWARHLTAPQKHRQPKNPLSTSLFKLNPAPKPTSHPLIGIPKNRSYLPLFIA